MKPNHSTEYIALTVAILAVFIILQLPWWLMMIAVILANAIWAAFNWTIDK